MMSWRWAMLLTLALVSPVTLPAGGPDRRKPEVQRRRQGEPILALASQVLRSAPRSGAPAVATLRRGSPMEVLQVWQPPRGPSWLRVRSGKGRGWLTV
jgi:hypothetical protein